MKLPNCDPEEIKRAVGLLAPEGTVVEVRALGACTTAYRRPHVESGYFNDVEALVSAVTSLRSAKGIFVTLNPVDPDLLSRASNRLRQMGRGDASTGDADIVRRIWLLVDVDPTRKSGISASVAEKEVAHQLAIAIYEHLRELGWPEPIVADSGNGYHLLFRVDLPVDEDDLVSRCLQALAARFDNDKATVDTSVFNPSRITKLYGTPACKGDSTDERPHRQSKILRAPEAMEVVNGELLGALAAAVVEGPSKTTSKKPRGRRGGASLEVAAWIGDHNVELIWDGDWKDGKKFVIDCPFNADHTDDSAYIVQFGSGALAAGCHHASCNWGWAELREKLDPQQAKPTSQTNRIQEQAGSPAAPQATMGEVGGVGGVDEEPDTRPEIEVETDIEPVVDAVELALVAELEIFWRGTVLVRIQRDGAVHAAQIPISALREMMSRRARFVALRKGRGGELEWRDVMPPTWAAQTLADRGTWPYLRELRGIVEAPTMRLDGTVLSKPGWDPQTGLLLVLPDGISFPPIPESPTLEDAQRALSVLAEPFAEFPFVSEADRSAAIAYVLTLLSRHAIPGNTPLFGITATCRGSGKGLICDVASIIATGRDAPLAPAPSDAEEWRKWLLATAIEATASVVLDNVDYPLGNAPLASALTAGIVTGRVLGVSATATLPWRVILAATGNGLSYRSDLARRVLPIRLDPGVERPEEIKFAKPRLLAWVHEHRADLLVAGLTVLRAYFAASRPDQGLGPWGSYQEWSNLISNALVWIGWPDPQDTRTEVLEAADLDADGIGSLLSAWHSAFGNTPTTCNQALKEAVSDGDLAEALGFFATGHAQLPSSRTLGKRLHGLRGRIVGGLRLLKAGSAHGNIGRWLVEKVPPTGTDSSPPLPPLPPTAQNPGGPGGSAGEVTTPPQPHLPHHFPQDSAEIQAPDEVGEVGGSEPDPALGAEGGADEVSDRPAEQADAEADPDGEDWGKMSTDSALHMLSELTALGIELSDHDGNVRFRPRSQMTPQLASRVRERKGEILDLLRLPRSWLDAYAEMRAATKPPQVTTADWEQWREDFRAFVTSPLAIAIHAAGWTLDDLAAVHATAPMSRLDCMGLVPLLDGAEIIEVAPTRVMVRLRTGAVQSVTKPQIDVDPWRRFWEPGDSDPAERQRPPASTRRCHSPAPPETHD